MTDTATEPAEIEAPEPTLEDLIAEATDDYIAEIAEIGKRWVKTHDRKWGDLPSTLRPALNVRVRGAVDIAIRPRKPLPARAEVPPTQVSRA